MLKRIQGCLLGVAIGDALGMPCESMSSDEILKETNGKGIGGFVSPIQRKIKGTRTLVVGSTTDDWQLTSAILSSLIRRREYDLTDIVLAHLGAYEESTFGWGGTTRSGLEELKLYFSSYGKEGRGIHTIPNVVEKRGLGNGIAMKIAPIALYEAMRHPHTKSDKLIRIFDKSIAFDFIYLSERVASIGKLTHSDVRAWSAAYAVALIIAETLLFTSFVENIDQIIHKRWLLDRLIKKVDRFEHKYGVMRDGFGSRLRVLLDDGLTFGPIEKLRSVVGTGYSSLESVCFAIAIFLRHPKDFKAGLLEAVNSGGDGDTICSIAGAMIGSIVGVGGIPESWIEFSSEFQKPIELGEQFYNTFTEKKDGQK